jgi:DNA-binding ferritin-like protein (Dps family)
MSNLLDKIFGMLEEKREWRRTQARARALPVEYKTAYIEIRDYLFRTSGIETIEPLKVLVDMLEEAAANDKRVLDVVGPDVATFADELVRGQQSYFVQQRSQLNARMEKKLQPHSKS